MEGIVDPVFVKDTTGHYLLLNQAAASSMERTKEEILGQNDHFLFSPDQAEKIMALDQEIMESGAVRHFMETTSDSEGQKIWQSFKGPYRDASGNIVGVVGLSRNITQMKLTEEKLGWLAKFPSENPNPVLRISRDGEVLYNNRASASLLEAWGHEKEKALGGPWLDIVRKVMDTGTREQIEERFEGKTLMLSFAPVTESGFVNIYGLDITDRKRAEEEVKWLAKFPSENPNPVLRISKKGEVLYNNRASSALLKAWEYKEGGKLEGDWLDTVRKALDTKTQLKTEQELLGKTLMLSFAPVTESGFVNIYGLDITDRKQVELERTSLNRQLQEKNRELEQIVYVTSHDLRSPLVNIQGFSNELTRSLGELKDLLRELESPDPLIKQLEQITEDDVPTALKFILSSVTKMDLLLKGLLRLSRLGRAAVNMETLDMNKLLREVGDTLEFQIKEKGANLEIAELPSCQGDRMLLNQLFSNLLDNALKYLDPTRPGVIKVWGKQEGTKVIYCVEDNGRGIDPAYHHKIFEIFHRLEPDATTGEGLGLTIVRRILDRHQGSIRVEGEAGKGCSFYITLPLGPTRKAMNSAQKGLEKNQ